MLLLMPFACRPIEMQYFKLSSLLASSQQRQRGPVHLLTLPPLQITQFSNVLLLRPQSRKPSRAGVNRSRPIRSSAGGARAVVRSAAHVVVGILLWGLCVNKVGVQEVVVHAEAKVSIDHGGGVVRGRHHPAVAGPGIRHLLVPGVVKLEATPVVVAQNTEPRLVAETRALVDAFENLIELVLRWVGDLVHGKPTSLLDASPVEVVPHIQDVPGLCKTWQRAGPAGESTLEHSDPHHHTASPSLKAEQIRPSLTDRG